MTKNELIAMLQRQEGNPIILLSCDEEGNKFHTVDADCSPEKDTKGNLVLILWPTYTRTKLAD